MNKHIASLFGTAQINIAADSKEQGRLAKGQALALAGGRARKVTCTSGMLWVTRDGDQEDHILGADESLELPPRGRVVLSALGGADYVVA